MQKKNIISIISIINLALIMILGPSVLASNTATVNATVTVQNISVSVSPGTVSYGTLAANSSKSTCEVSATQTVTNDGNVTEDFNIKGQNSANWILDSTPSTDHYVHKFATTGCPWTNGTALTTDYQTLATDVATSSNITLNLQITTPNPSTVFSQQSVDVIVQAVAHQ